MVNIFLESIELGHLLEGRDLEPSFWNKLYSGCLLPVKNISLCIPEDFLVSNLSKMFGDP